MAPINIQGNDFWMIACTVIIVFALVKFMFSKISFYQSANTTEWPVGPKTLPIIGNLHQLGGGMPLQVALANLAKVYGGAFTVWIGSWVPMIIISDIDNAREVLVNRSADYSARDVPDILKIITANGKNIADCDSGPFWHNLKKGLQSCINPSNVMSLSRLQEKDMQNLIKSMQERASQQNGIVKPLDHAKEASMRLLSRVIFGQDFSNEDLVIGVKDALDEMVRISGLASLADAFKIAKYLPSQRKNIRDMYATRDRVYNLIQPHIVSNLPANSFLHFLTSQDYSDEIIYSMVLEIFGLGVDSTAATAVWALSFLVCEQEIQEKLYREINNLTGGQRPVKVVDLKELPYLQAVMKETLRMKPIAPLAVPHVAAKDTTLKGRRIVKGTKVMVNLYAIHHDPNVFPAPYKFMPERFLKDVNSDGRFGDINTMESSLIPFSAGMRICGGVELAKQMVAFALASMVNEFKWDCVSEGKFPDLSEAISFILYMKNPLEAKITPRTKPFDSR
uniref:Salutaridine synthase n=1 Tax=Papaver somniferum TaxID=3469 RepID=A0A0S3QNW6_PAPSO|nr:salutaridine synthase [Papaver somniferum]